MQPTFSAPSAARTFDLEELVSLVQRGHIRVPHFQRDFRWESKDVRRLFDSIVRGYPIGSLLLWRRPAPEADIIVGALNISAPQLQEALWVVDGQQRLTSLANALDVRAAADARFALSYDLMDEVFVAPNSADPTSSLPLPVLFDLRRLLAWFNDHPDMADHVSKANEVATKLRKFTIPSYVVDSTEMEVLQDIFDRMNNYGKRLSRAEIFSALYAPEESKTEDKLTISRVAESCDELTGFGRIDDDTVLRVILARRGPDVTREIRFEFDSTRRNSGEFPDESRDRAFDAGQESLVRTVRFLQEHAGVPHFSFLPYRYLLVVTARFLAHHPDPHPQNSRLLRRWFWRAAAAGPEIFKGSATGAMRQLCSRVDAHNESGSIQTLLSAVDGTEHSFPDLSRFRTNEASTRIVLCAMWARQPRSLMHGEPFERQGLSEALLDRSTAADVAREIIPRRALPSAQRTWAANRILLSGLDEPLNEIPTFLAAPGIAESESHRSAVLDSHFFDEEAAHLLASDQPSDFLSRRQASLDEYVRDWLTRMCEWRFENTPPLEDFDLDDERRDDSE